MDIYRISVVYLWLLWVIFDESDARYKANKKCAEYSRLAASIRKAELGLIDDSPYSNEKFPHMAAVGFDDNGTLSWKCGGIIVSERYILTAAHCTIDRNLGPAKWVHVGSTNLNNGGVNLEIAKIIEHPEFKLPWAYYNDIALLKLKNIIRFSKSRLPACLNTNFGVKPITKLVATGWGAVGFRDLPSADLLQVELSLSTHRECNLSYANVSKRRLPNGVDSSTQICIWGGPDGDTCQGDSGGPVGMKTGELHTVVGVLSFGKPCGLTISPSVYSRVSAYVPWIEQNVWS